MKSLPCLCRPVAVTALAIGLGMGNGTVDGRQLLGATKLPAAGRPGTAGNP